MKQKFYATITLIAFLMGATGCASIPEEHRGAAVGAGVGAVAGGLIGDGTKGTIVGGLVGALIGGAIGHYFYDRKRTRARTQEAYKYNPAQGALLTLEDASTAPQNIVAGQSVNLSMTYAVLNPTAGATMDITETREITYNGQIVGRPEVRVARSDGTYTSTIPLKLPANAQKGVYQVKSTVMAQNASDIRVAQFSVR